MPDAIANLFLLLIHPYFILFIMIMGFYLIDRSIFFQAACLLAFSVVLNVALKATFQVPLSPSLHKTGFAFPSGHMQSASVFYGFCIPYLLAWPTKWLALVVLLVGIGASLIHYDYHTLQDVLGAVLVAWVILTTYHYALKQRNQRFILLFMLFISTALMIYNVIIYNFVPFHAWFAYMTLAALSLIKWKELAQANHDKIK